MIGVTNFFLAFIFSFIGSIPPGTINLTVIQLGLENRVKTALKFSTTAALMEYPYAWIAVKFEKLITSSPAISENIQLAGGIIMIVIGILNLLPASKNPSPYSVTLSKSGYRRGLILGILNPLAIPYWIGFTTLLKGQRWIELSTPYRLHSYLLGVVIGAFLILVAYAYVGKKILSLFKLHPWFQRIPGLTILVLGVYTIAGYLITKL